MPMVSRVLRIAFTWITDFAILAAALTLGVVFLSPLSLLLLILAAFLGEWVLEQFVFRRLATRKRKAMGSPPARETLENPRIARRFAWDQVGSVALMRKRTVRIGVGVHVFRARVKREDYEPLREFLYSRIGVKLSVREGTL